MLLSKEKTLSIFNNIIFFCLILYSLTFLFHLKINFLVTAFYFALFKYLIFRPKITINSKHIHLIILFIFCAFLSLIFNDVHSINSSYLSEFKARFISPLTAFLLAFFFRFTEKNFLILLSGFALFLSMNALVILYQSTFLGQTGRLTGLVNENAYMLLCVNLLIVPVIFTYAIYDKKLDDKLRYFFLFTILINIPAIIFENTRIVWIGLSIVFPIILFFSIKNKIKLISIIIVALLSISCIFYTSPSSMQRFKSITNINYENQSNSERILMWQSATKMFIEHPIFGVGIANYHDEYITSYRSPLARENTTHPHNTLLYFLSETGLVGSLPLVILFSYLFYNVLITFIKKKNTISLAYLMCLTAYTINNMTDSLFSSNSCELLTYIFYLFTGVYLSLNNYISTIK
ncbi:O-antigen ligase family protein [Megamonas hypermegale]|uniref:O-antigen ligase family protein n=1 Tax=Megamonas hypermegale TaxID=158847 RepID=UPI0032098E06